VFPVLTGIKSGYQHETNTNSQIYAEYTAFALLPSAGFIFVNDRLNGCKKTSENPKNLKVPYRVTQHELHMCTTAEDTQTRQHRQNLIHVEEH
jgi:hypothetical protein